MWNIVLVWAWGTGMSGVAGILYELWFENIVCVDSIQSQLTDRLRSQWLRVVIWHGKYDVEIDDFVIYSSAAINSPEVQKALSFPDDTKQLRIVWDYFEFLWEVSKYFSTVAITGTNGKSSTTAIGLYAAAALLPNFGVGILWALVPDFGEKNYVISTEHRQDIQKIFQSIFSKKEFFDPSLIKKYVFMLEACEYKRHFLHLDVDQVLLTSLTCDHLDYFEDEKDYFSAFEEFFQKVKYNIFILEDEDLPENNKVSNSWQWRNQMIKVKKKEFDFDNIFGDRNSWNASLLSSLFSFVYGVDQSSFSAKIKSFSGLWRRMEFLWRNKNEALIYSDYGHMAESISMWYEALKSKFHDKNIVVCFQPHQLRRVITEWNEFIAILSKYNQCYIYNIYFAREKMEDYKSFYWFQWLNNFTVNSIGNLFAEKIWWKYFELFDDVWNVIKSLDKDSIFVFYSAGNLDYLIRQKLI